MYLASFSVMIVLVTYLIYTYIIVPKRTINCMARKLEEKGYKVLRLTFNPLSIPFYLQLVSDGFHHQDPYYTHKQVYPDYDIIVTNMLYRPALAIVNDELLREVMSAGKVMIMPKEKKITEVFFSIIRKGIFSL